jgi:hypothetical protein
MASPNENASMALFCDFENVALGVRDANYEKFDIKPVLERGQEGLLRLGPLQGLQGPHA